MEKLDRNIRSLIVSEMTLKIDFFLFEWDTIRELGGGGQRLRMLQVKRHVKLSQCQLNVGPASQSAIGSKSAFLLWILRWRDKS